VVLFLSLTFCKQEEKIMFFGNATVNNISVISWWSLLLVEKTTISHRQTLSHNVVSIMPHHERDSISQL
jgi:hypothetical protein